jgi:hypothetical protein
MLSSSIAALEIYPSGGVVNRRYASCRDHEGSIHRVHRLFMAPKNTSDDFGYRLGRRFFVYQVTIENQSTDHQFLLHDVSIDLSTLFSAQPGTYLYTASSQDLTLLRGIPEKGQDLDKRNLTLHILQGVGSVAGAVSGLTSFSDVRRGVLEVVASERTSVVLCHSQRNAVGPELVAQARVQTLASDARYPGAPRQWLPRLPSCKRNSDEQFRRIAEIASTETRPRRWLASHRDNLHSCDQ